VTSCQEEAVIPERLRMANAGAAVADVGVRRDLRGIRRRLRGAPGELAPGQFVAWHFQLTGGAREAPMLGWGGQEPRRRCNTTRACARGLPRTHTTLRARPCEARPIGPRAKERGAHAANKKMGRHANDKLSDAFTEP
jgi:hypothetical protein